MSMTYSTGSSQVNIFRRDVCSRRPGAYILDTPRKNTAEIVALIWWSNARICHSNKFALPLPANARIEIKRKIIAMFVNRLEASKIMSSLLRSASKAWQRKLKWSCDSSSLSYRGHIVSSDWLIRFVQRRSSGWWPLQNRPSADIWDLDSWTCSRWSGRLVYLVAWSCVNL